MSQHVIKDTNVTYRENSKTQIKSLGINFNENVQTSENRKKPIELTGLSRNNNIVLGMSAIKKLLTI
jgi:hypothetical protein